mgnify:CR=1 FL=1
MVVGMTPAPEPDLSRGRPSAPLKAPWPRPDQPLLCFLGARTPLLHGWLFVC